MQTLQLGKCARLRKKARLMAILRAGWTRQIVGVVPPAPLRATKGGRGLTGSCS